MEKITTFSRDDFPIGFNEETLFKVYDALRAMELDEQIARECIREMQNRGILFRELIPEPTAIKNPSKGFIVRCSLCGVSFQDPDGVDSDALLRTHMNEHGFEWLPGKGYRIRKSPEVKG
jgi:hypothetical protein